MFFVAGVAIAIVAALGVGIKFLLDYAVRKSSYTFTDMRVTWSEYGIAMALVTALVVPLVLVIGEKLSIDQKLKYEEMYNGVEVAADVQVTECYAGQSGSSTSAGQSNCTYTFVSGSYSWTESYPVTSCTTDSQGRQSCTTTIQTTTYYADIYTPYATHESVYTLTNSFGQTHTYRTVIANDARQYDGNKAIPADIPRGAPPDWDEAKRRLDAGDPRPVTDVFEYDNYILASGDEMLAPFSNDVRAYLDKGLLPEHTAKILGNPIYGESRKQAKKLSFVGLSVPNEDVWQESLMRFNAALGSKLQGDLHVVVADSGAIDDPHRYGKALRAHWLGGHFGKRALSKNGIILVIGVKAGKVDWAIMDTGMPFGNNVMIETVQNLLPGKDIDPDVIFGKPRTVVIPATIEGEDDEVKVTLSTPRSVLEDVMLEGAAAFKRPCMKCEDEEDAGSVGYKDLIAQIEPSTGQKIWMVVIIVFASLFFWGFVAGTPYLEVEHWRSRHARQQPPSIYYRNW